MVVVGNHDLLPNTPDQEVEIYVSGPAGFLIQGINFGVVIGDGGSIIGGIDGAQPEITGVDLISAGHLFSPNHNLFFTLGSPHLWQEYCITVTGYVSLDGTNQLLATIAIDTTGFTSGTFPLVLFGEPVASNLGPTDFAGIPIDGTDGTVTIVPEPSAFVLGCLIAVGLATWSRRRIVARAF